MTLRKVSRGTDSDRSWAVTLGRLQGHPLMRDDPFAGASRSYPVLDGLAEMSMLGLSRNLTAGGGRIQCKEGSSRVLSWS